MSRTLPSPTRRTHITPDHDSKRALFLAKIFAPPSPTAIDLPVTPPDSPAIFFFTLPSPGLMSPLALFETLSNKKFASWVEQVEFRSTCGSSLRSSHLAPEDAPTRVPIPSLEEISYYFRLPGRPQPCATRPRPPLPAFLNKRRVSLQTIKAPASPRLQVTTNIMANAPDNPLTSGTALTEANLTAFEQRIRASLLLQKLKRRLQPLPS